MIQIGGVCIPLSAEEGILLQKHRYSNRRCIAILFRSSIGVRCRLDSPEFSHASSLPERKRSVHGQQNGLGNQLHN